LERGRTVSSAHSICCQLYDADDYAVVAPLKQPVDFRIPYVRVKKERKPSDNNTKRKKRNQISEQKIAQQKAIRGPIIRKDKQIYSYLLVCIGLVEVNGGIKREKEIKTTNRNLRPTRRKSTKNISCLQVN